jgi:hypothetical protein
MYRLRLTLEFQDWLDRLTDRRGQARIAARLRRVELGNLATGSPSEKESPSCVSMRDPVIGFITRDEVWWRS